MNIDGYNTHIVDLKHPREIASLYILENYYDLESKLLKIHYFKGEFLVWKKSHYEFVDVEYLRSSIYQFLLKKRTYSGERVPTRKRHVDEIIDALKSLTYLHKSSLPVWFRRENNFPENEILAAKNKLIHIVSKKEIDHTPNFINRASVNYNYKFDAPKPIEWQKFLNSIWPDDRESIEALQEWFGLLLTLDTSHQKSLMLVGPKRCGKGTIGRVLKELVGAQNTCSPTFAGLSSHFGLANLINKQLAIISDARLSNRTDTTVLVENILRITGEDSVSVARKYLGDWDGKLSARFVIMTNLVPALSESSGALAGRFIILKIKTSFYGKEDLSLTERLLAELPSILNWSLEGLDRLRARKHLIQPSSATQYLDQLETLSSPIKFFVSENCIVTPMVEIPCESLFDRWRSWCHQQNSDHVGTIQQFGRNLAGAFPEIEVKQRRIGSKQKARYYVGIRLKIPELDDCEEE